MSNDIQSSFSSCTCTHSINEREQRGELMPLTLSLSCLVSLGSTDIMEPSVAQSRTVNAGDRPLESLVIDVKCPDYSYQHLHLQFTSIQTLLCTAFHNRS